MVMEIIFGTEGPLAWDLDADGVLGECGLWGDKQHKVTVSTQQQRDCSTHETVCSVCGRTDALQGRCKQELVAGTGRQK